MSEIAAAVMRSKKDAAYRYDRMSRWYDLIAGGSEKRFTARGLGMLRAEGGETVLEIGSGTGQGMTFLAGAVGRSGRVYGVDISKGMIDISRRKLGKTGLSSRVGLLRGDGVSLPFRGRVFDAVFLSFTLELFAPLEISMVINECLRVLRRDGRICVVSMSKTGSSRPVMRLYEWMHRRFPKYIDCRPIFLRAVLEGSGLHVVDTDEVRMWGLAVEVVLAEVQ